MNIPLSAYPRLLDSLKQLPDSKKRGHLRNLCRTDLYFLLRYAMGRKDIEHPWLFARTREVQDSPDGYLDLWAREHYKSTIITFAKTIQDILASHGEDPLIDKELTIGIFSHTRPSAKKFLRQIKLELEGNRLLQEWFPDILYANPQAESPKWSEDMGLMVKRRSNAKEMTVESWGLVDGQPTGSHFDLLVYDDIVTRESVTSPDMIQKTTEAMELSYNLGAHGGKRRFIGTRYHFNDTYRTIISRGTAQPRIYAATEDGQVDGVPVMLPPEVLAEKRRDMGPYTFACHGTGTMVLMADWSHKPIEHVEVGDLVVGWTMESGQRAKLSPTRVLAKKSRTATRIQATLESGRKVVCTPDHKWFTGRRDGGTHKVYAPLGFGYGEVKALTSVYDPRLLSNNYDVHAAGYLAGVFDGEGSLSSGTLHIAQCERTNPAVCEKIRWSLSALGFDFNECRPASRKHHIDFTIRGGRTEIIRFLNVCKPAKSPRIQASLFENGTRNFGKGMRDKLVSVDGIGDGEVWNIQTETGNYVAGGYASKNCQMMQNPKADETQGFKRDWLRYHRSAGTGMNIYILCDPASEKKKGSDYTAFEVIGLGPDLNYYTLELIRDRLSLKERGDVLFRLHRKWRPLGVGYEKYGMQADIEHMKDKMSRESYHFDIIPLGGQMAKNDRIRRLIPLFEQGRWYLPESCFYTDYEGITKDLISVFLAEEYDAFPVSVHDDMFDVKARILEEDLGAIFPKAKEMTDRYQSSKRKSGSSWAA